VGLASDGKEPLSTGRFDRWQLAIYSTNDHNFCLPRPGQTIGRGEYRLVRWRIAGNVANDELASKASLYR
jgi:hypothetical protein